MERLSDRAIAIVNELHTERLDYQSEYLPLIDALNQLAAYENTRITPEALKKPFTEDALLILTASVLRLGVDRLRELAQAEKDGRLVVLPCRVGDTVYVVLMGRVFPFEVISVMLHGDTPTFKAQHGMHLCWVFGNDDIGKTVFLTREEAEEALEGGGEA